jgi:outer membrane protein
MKNLSWILNVILLVAVGILYYLHFKSSTPAAPETETTEAPKTIILSPSNGIVFVNSDSLLDQYEFYKNKKREFEASQDRIKRDLKAEGDKLRDEFEQYQQQGGSMTDQQRAQKEEQLTLKQQQLMEKKDMMLSKLDDEQSKSSDQLYDNLHNFFKKYNKGKNFQYVLGVSKGGGVLYANDSLDITRQVLTELNKEFKK